MAAVIPWIEEILEADQKAPRKQRHTAHRIWCRLKAERPEAEVGESTVREYVRKRKIELGLEHGEVFVPQTLSLGPGRASGLVRGLRRDRRRAGQSLRILHAEHGQRRSVSPGLSARQPAGVSGSTRVGIRLFWRRVSRAAFRQSEECGEADSAGPPTGRDGALHRVPVALGIRSRSFARLGKGTKKAAWKSENGYLPAESSGAAAEGGELGRAERDAAGGM